MPWGKFENWTCSGKFFHPVRNLLTKNSFISPNSAIKPSAYTQLTWEGRNVKKHTPLRTLIIGNNWNRFANFMKYFSFFLLFSLLCTPLLTLQRKIENKNCVLQVWMRNHEERRENNDFIWKVLLPECFIKLYMDHFSFDKKEAEKRIRNTPLHEEDDIP